MNESQVSPSELTAGDTTRLGERPSGPAGIPLPPDVYVGPTRWTAGRSMALVIGALMVLLSVSLLGGGGTVLWADLTHRDAAGYVTTEGEVMASTTIPIGCDPSSKEGRR